MCVEVEIMYKAMAAQIITTDNYTKKFNSAIQVVRVIIIFDPAPLGSSIIMYLPRIIQTTAYQQQDTTVKGG